MNQTILLLGPSGIGKTTVIKEMTKNIPSVVSVILDNITHRHARNIGLINPKADLNALIAALDHDRERFLSFGREALALHCESIEDKAIIVDVGTGFLDASNSTTWINEYPSICLTATPAEAFDRFRKARQLDITYEQYMTTQFSKNRLNTYQLASIVIKSDGLTPEVTAHRFACTVLGMLSPETAKIALSEWLNS
ncbi:AAA family ATPase [Shewanella sp. A25]|nr:AAA family ATPase [Shewanella shenzhenensis]